MSIEIYWISGSAPAWRILLMLESKHLEYQSRILQTSLKEQKQPWFLELNPRGQIPLLKDDDIIVCESFAIMHYLEKRYPAITLLGDTPAQTAAVAQSMHETMAYTDKQITEFVQPVFRNKVAQCRDAFPKIVTSIHEELSVIETRLAESEWMTGEFSAADIVLIPTIQRLLRAINKARDLAEEIGLGSLETDYPGLMAWNRKVEALPAFVSTFPPHWREEK